MAVYTVFEHPAKGPDHTVFIREGFSSSAFVLSVLWALWHRMWVVAAVLLAVFAALSLVAYHMGLQEAPASVLNLGISVIFGLEAQDLRASSLRRAGYRETGLIMAGDLEEAEFKHAHALKTKPIQSVSERPLMQPPTDTLGLFGNV